MTSETQDAAREPAASPAGSPPGAPAPVRRRYDLAAAAAALAAAAVVALAHPSATTAALVLMAGVVVAGCYGRAVTAALAGLLATAVLEYLYMLPLGAHSVAAALGHLAIFVGTGLLVALLSEAGRGIYARLERERATTARLYADSQASERRFRALVEHASEMTAVLDRDLTVLYASPSYAAALAYEPHELEQRGAREFIDERSHATVGEALARVLEDPGGSVELDIIAMHRHGGVRHLRTVAQNLLDDPAVGGIVAHSRDVTDTVQAEHGRRSAEERLAVILTQLPVVVWTTDTDLRFTGNIGGAIGQFGVAANALAGQALAEVVGAVADASSIVDAHYRALGGEAVAFDTSWSGRQLEAHLEPLRDADGRIVGTVGVGIDLTRQHELERQLREAQKMEAVGLLAGGIAHDFNNLLTAIRSYAELLLGDLPPESPARADVNEIILASQRAAALTRQLLAFGRRQVLQATPLHVGDVVGQVEPLLRRILGEDVRLETSCPGGLPPVLADGGQLEQVLLNLAVNARDAMPEGGVLRIAVDAVQLSGALPCVGGAVPPGRYVTLSVRDSGIGMDAATQARIFEPFFTTKAVGRGSGLGLPTVLGIVQQSNGYLTVTSRPGEGSEFSIFLPGATPAHEPAPAGAAGGMPSRAPVHGGSAWVLLAEDEPSVRLLAERILTTHGFRVVVAADGREALAKAEQLEAPLTLLVTDVVMPYMSGGELAERMQARYPGLRVLYVSGYPEDERVRRTVEEARAPLLPKPFSPAELLEAVRTVPEGGAPGG